VAAAFEHPAFGLADGGDAGVAMAAALPELEQPVDLVEYRGEEAIAFGEAEAVAGVDEFVEVDAGGGGTDATDGLDDGKGTTMARVQEAIS
jgi:hypothetical protein